MSSKKSLSKSTSSLRSSKLETVLSKERRPSSSLNKSISSSEKKEKKSRGKYKFHPEYLTAAPDDKGPPKTGSKPSKLRSRTFKHDKLDDDSYWERHYRIINYRRRFPEDYKEKECEDLYDWLCNMSLDDAGLQAAKSLLFSAKQDVTTPRLP